MTVKASHTWARFSREIAEELVKQYGMFAYIHALETMETREQPESKKLWRDVLSVLDEITNERNENDNAELRTTETNQPDRETLPR